MPTHREDPRKRLLRRHPDNPLLTAFDWPYFVNTVFNPGATRLPDGETLLLCRVEDCTGKSHFCVARSENGVSDWRIDPHPTFAADAENHPEELGGIEDPRVVWVPELESHVITYTCFSRMGPGVSLALSPDFHKYERLGMILPPENKDAALLPRRIDGRWVMVHRPVPRTGSAHIWMSFSPDLKHWGDHTQVMRARDDGWWDVSKIGLSPPMIETDQGWLMMYHGVRQTASGSIYRLGLALFDLEEPTRCIRRGLKWIMGPETEYEQRGDVPDVVFPGGYTLEPDGDTINLYYGAADTSICLATGSIREMLDWLDRNSTPGDGQ